MKKVLIAEPIYTAMTPDVYMNRIEFWKTVWGNDVPQGFYRAMPLVMGPRRNIRSARDIAIRKALELDATHLFFLDDDIKVTPQILDVLLRQDKAIIGGLIHKDDGTPVIFADSPDGEVQWLSHPKSGSFECAAIGAGCMLISVAVLKRLMGLCQEKPAQWLFNYDHTKRSMDVLFCRLARSCGFTVWCWPDIPCTQIVHY